MYQTDSKIGKVYAALVAVGDYSNLNATNLPTYNMDLAFMKNSLVQGLLVDPDNIRVLGNQGVVRAKDLALALKSFSEMLAEEDSLIFYFSGHGKRSELIFSDMSIKLDSVLDYLDKLHCKTKLVILDCCYSGDFQIDGPKQMAFGDTISSFAGSGIAIMASSAADEVSRLGIAKQYSLYTEIVGTAMMSKRKVRKGYLSLDDINAEVFQMMNIWNSQYPKKKQNPIYRSCLGGTIYFKVSEYIPYQQKNIHIKSYKYTVHSVKSLSTDRYKRICVFVLCEKADDLLLLSEITHEIAEYIKYENIFSSEAEERRFANTVAHAIWCYFGKDESDLIRHLHCAYTIWAKDEEMKKLYFKENRYSQVIDGIFVYQNTSYAMLKKMQAPTVSREEFVSQNQKLLSEIVSMAEEFIFDLKEIVNRTIDVSTVQERYKKWILEVRSKYILLSDMDSPPDDLYDWANEIMGLAGWVLDISLLLEGEMGDREFWLINNSTRQYNESLVRLTSLEAKI